MEPAPIAKRKSPKVSFASCSEHVSASDPCAASNAISTSDFPLVPRTNMAYAKACWLGEVHSAFVENKATGPTSVASPCMFEYSCLPKARETFFTAKPAAGRTWVVVWRLADLFWMALRPRPNKAPEPRANAWGVARPVPL